MKSQNIIKQILVVLLVVSLLLPGLAVAKPRTGKTNFRAGLKHEAAEQWEQAAREFALAAAIDPSNSEYKLHLIRAMQNAALMFIKRGDTLAAQQDLAGAYTAYQQALNFDQSNEMARIKMQRIVELQQAQSGITQPVNYNPVNNTGRPARQQATRPREIGQMIDYKNTSLRMVIQSLARQLELNVLFDESFKDNEKYTVRLENVGAATALDMIFVQNKLIFEQLNRQTILIYPDDPQRRMKMERLQVKTFYLSNADLTEVRTLVQNLFPPGVGRQIGVVKQLNALVVRATPQELTLVQEVIDSVDKNRAEVVIDVDIYEVSNDTASQIGQQLLDRAPDGKNIPSLSNFGGIAFPIQTALTFGNLLSLPQSSMSLLQKKGKSRLLASTKVHALDGQQNQTKVGESVPVSLGSFVPGFNVQPNQNGQNGQQNPNNANLNGAFESIQYKDVGLVIDVTPTITNEGFVEVKMKLESTSVVEGTASAQNRPRFTQRTLATIARIRDSETSVIANIKREEKSEARSGIPVVSMLPIIGNLFSAPSKSTRLSDIIITVTPHIVRPVDVKKEDHLAHASGTQQSGVNQSIVDVVHRLKADEVEEVNSRPIAQQPVLSPPPVALPAAPEALPAKPQVEAKEQAENKEQAEDKKQAEQKEKVIAAMIPAPPAMPVAEPAPLPVEAPQKKAEPGEKKNNE